MAWAAGLIGAVVGTRIASDDRAPAPDAVHTRAGRGRAAHRAAAGDGRARRCQRHRAQRRQHRQLIDTDTSGSLRGSGTGVVLTADGEIVTNAHVVDGADRGHRAPAGRDRASRRHRAGRSDAARDLALLRIDADGLRPAEFAAPADIRVGDDGARRGLRARARRRPVGHRGHRVGARPHVGRRQKALKGLIQTDAPISSGNSGGPLVNSLGQVVGIITFVAVADGGSQANDLGFAISNAELLPSIERLRAEATPATPPPASSACSSAPRVDGGQRRAGHRGRARFAGRRGRVCRSATWSCRSTACAITGEAGLVATIRDHAPGDELTIELRRDGEPLVVTATLVVRPAD